MKNLRRRLPSANALVVFESAARHASFTRAAAELGVSQPAVTRQVKAVEAAAGRPLFRRRHNRLALTAEGLALWSAVSTGLTGIAEALADIARSGERRRLVVAVDAGFAQQWLVPRMAEFARLLPDAEVRLTISEGDGEAAPDGADFGVRAGTGPWPGQKGHKLADETVVPVASPALLAAWPALRTGRPDALPAAPLLHNDAGDRPWMSWRHWFRLLGITEPPPRPETLYYNYPLVLQEALGGRGVALGFRPLVDPLLARGALVAVGPPVTRRDTGYWLSWPPDGPMADLAPAICEWFDGKLAALRAPGPAG